jgi:hypothetical protein
MTATTKEFLEEIAELCYQHGLSLKFDKNSFIVCPYDPAHSRFLLQADDRTVDRPDARPPYMPGGQCPH